MPGRGTTDAIFIIHQLQEKYLANKKNLYCVFVDIEKAFDRAPQSYMVGNACCGSSNSVVQAMYSGAISRVRFSDEFDVKVGVYQGSVLLPLLFIISFSLFHYCARSFIKKVLHWLSMGAAVCR